MGQMETRLHMVQNMLLHARDEMVNLFFAFKNQNVSNVSFQIVTLSKEDRKEKTESTLLQITTHTFDL